MDGLSCYRIQSTLGYSVIVSKVHRGYRVIVSRVLAGYILQTSRPAPEKKVLTQKQAFELLRLRGFVIKDDPAVLASA